MGTSALLKNAVSIEEWMAATKEKKILYSEKNCSLRLSTVTYKEKMFLGTTTLDHSLFFISLRFLCICQ